MDKDIDKRCMVYQRNSLHCHNSSMQNKIEGINGFMMEFTATSQGYTIKMSMYFG